MTAQFSISPINTVYAQTPQITTPPPNPPLESNVVQLKAYVDSQAKAYGVNPEVASFIVQHESQWNPSQVGDSGTSFGLWQIHLPSHPNITKGQALDYRWSTQWAMKQILAGNINMWSSVKFCHKWYLDCSL